MTAIDSTPKMLDKETSDKLIKFYGEGVNSALHAHNKGLIYICPNCSKVDIRVLTHPDECNPIEEFERRQTQEVYWK